MADFANREHYVDGVGGTGGDLHDGTSVGREPCSSHRHPVSPIRDKRDGVNTAGVGRGLKFRTDLRIGQFDLGTGYHGAARIGHDAGNLATLCLSPCNGNEQQ